MCRFEMRRDGLRLRGAAVTAAGSGRQERRASAPHRPCARRSLRRERSSAAHPDVVARGFVIYVGLDEDTAAAEGTSLHKIATELRDYVEHIAPESQVHIAMAMASAAAEGSDLEVVRQALGDPTVAHR